MTIIHNQKSKKTLAFPLITLGVLLASALVLVLFWYNQIVNLNHELGAHRDALQEVQARNADLKQSVYNLVSYENLERIALARNLAKEKNPHYLEEQPTDLSRR